MSRARGFTLLEMMVAIAILAVASSAVYFSNSEALSSQVKLEEQTIAQWALANQVAYYRLTQKVDGNPFLDSLDFQSNYQQISVAGLDLEIQMRKVPISFQSAQLEIVNWEVYRVVDSDLVGPLRSYSAVFEVLR